VVLARFVVLPPVYASDADWLEAKSSHFRVLSDGSAEEARAVAHQFEQIRTAFATALPSIRLETAVPLTVLALKDDQSVRALLPQMWKQKALKPGGLFAEGREKTFAIVRLDVVRRQSESRASGNGYQVVYHEYTHSVLNSNFRWLPLWLNEGLAEFFGNTQFDNDKIYIGAANVRAEYTRGRPLLPIEKLLSVAPGSGEYEDADKVQVFYSESWGLVHLLLTGPLSEGGRRLQQYIKLLDDGIDARQAFREAIGEFKEIEDQLKKYLDRAGLDSFVFNNPSDVSNEKISVRRLDIAETNAELGTVEVWLHENAAARERLERAMKADSRSALAVESMGVLSFNEGADRPALTFFEQALQRDLNRLLSGYYRGMLTTAPSPALLDVIKQNPDFAPAHVQLAMAYLREGNTDRALAPALKAAQLHPSLGGYHVLVGNILHGLGRDSEAAAVARFVAERWRDVHRDEAVELWLKLPASLRQGVELSKRSPVPGTRIVSGKVTSLECRDKDQTMKLVIDNAPLTLRVKDDKAGFGLSDTVWYGPDHFNRCRHLEGLRVVVQYRNAELIQLDVMTP